MGQAGRSSRLAALVSENQLAFSIDRLTVVITKSECVDYGRCVFYHAAGSNHCGFTIGFGVPPTAPIV